MGKRKAWEALPGCDCGSESKHAKYVKHSCSKWECNCKSMRGSRGGNNKHHENCKRGRFIRHTEPFVLPKEGDRLAMLGDARSCGMPDRMFGACGWIDDLLGRDRLRSAWMDMGDAQALM